MALARDYRLSRRQGYIPEREDTPITSEQARNDPDPWPEKPKRKVRHEHISHSARNEAVAGVVDHTNQVLAYECGSHENDLPLPGQGNVDERMPLFFMRPCIIALNELIKKYSLDITPLPEIGDSIDYHGIPIMANNIIEHCNIILDLLPDRSYTRYE